LEFEWDEAKRASNRIKHGFDFARASELFNGQPVVTYKSDFAAEPRWVTVGMVLDRLVALVWTPRMNAIRVISLRSARDAEKRDYRALFDG
jgi:uncharacterized DUF497 family protein